jgi:hypothetical protein
LKYSAGGWIGSLLRFTGNISKGLNRKSDP